MIICPENGKKRKELVQSPDRKGASSGDHSVLTKFQGNLPVGICDGNFALNKRSCGRHSQEKSSSGELEYSH